MCGGLSQYACLCVIGGYYTYLYAQMWSAQIWANRFQGNPLSREAGMHYRTRLLQYGASRDKLFMLQEVGSKPHQPLESLSPAYYLTSNGL